jgi:hypothetical protein
VPVICLFAPLGALQSVWVTVGQVFLAKNRPDWYFRWGVVGGIIFVCSFLVGLPWGIFGVALSYTLTSTVWAVVSFWIAFKLVRHLTLWNLAKVLQPYVLAAGAMALLVTLCRFLLVSLGIAPQVILPVCIMVGVILYVLIAFVLWPPAVDDILRLMPQSVVQLIRRLRTRPDLADERNAASDSQPQPSGCGRIVEIADMLPVPESAEGVHAQ